MNNKNEADSDTAPDDIRMLAETACNGSCSMIVVSHLESQMDEGLMWIHPNMKFSKVTVKQNPELNTSTQRVGYAFQSQWL
jgi:hypothetical protein